MTRRPVPSLWIAAGTGVWLAAFGNAPLWRELHRLGLLEGAGSWTLATASALILMLLITALLSLLAWPGMLRPAAAILLLVAAAGAHYMADYGVVIDPGMLVNVLQTDWNEARALLDWPLVRALLLLMGLPLLLLSRVEARRRPWRQAAVRNSATALTALLLAFLLGLLVYQPLASAMRNHKHLRYLVNPLNTLWAVGVTAAQPLQRPPLPPLPVGLDADLAPVHARPPLLLLVLGETGRSGNFGLNGYRRDTTPELAREGVASFRNAWSCGTSTAASVPCMFSPLGRASFEARTRDTEGLLDVLQHAGLAVLWIDNQSGCKGVCDRIASVNVSASRHPVLCPAGECLDGILLEGLDARLADLPPERRAKGVVLVLHPAGSHGPAYHLRSPPAFKRFGPECTTAALQSCSREQIVNAYDHSIAYTDHVLASAIRWLRGRERDWNAGLLYVADHGESLGENNLYLHGLPYALAPDVQKHVPWITWLSAGLQRDIGVSAGCLRGLTDVRLTHDNYFHTVLGLLQVRTGVYRPALDAYAPCRVP